MVYRFRPDPHDHRKCLYEVLFLRPVAKDGVRPMPAEPIQLEDHQSFKEAEGMDPGFGAILDQDTDNLVMQQQGLEASARRSEEHTSELQSLMRISYAVFCLKTNNNKQN